LVRPKFIVAVSSWRMADRSSRVSPMRPGRTGGSIKTRDFAARTGTQRARSRTPSVKFIVAVSPWRLADRYAPRGAQEEASKRATLRRGWGHSGLDPELLRSRLIVAVSPWRMADRYAPRGVQEEASKRATLRRGWGHSGLDPELLRSRLIVAVSPWRMADRYAPRGVQEEASKRATLRRGWGDRGHDPDLLRSNLS